MTLRPSLMKRYEPRPHNSRPVKMKIKARDERVVTTEPSDRHKSRPREARGNVTLTPSCQGINYLLTDFTSSGARFNLPRPGWPPPPGGPRPTGVVGSIGWKERTRGAINDLPSADGARKVFTMDWNLGRTHLVINCLSIPFSCSHPTSSSVYMCVFGRSRQSERLISPDLLLIGGCYQRNKLTLSLLGLTKWLCFSPSPLGSLSAIPPGQLC